jgi:uncharacterized membrane protein YphA (DoxX/SURF4 family)
VAIDRQGTALAILRICVGVFFLFEGIGKLSWFSDTSMLARQLDGWLRAAPAGSWSHMFLQRAAVPGSAIFARLVPLGELSSGAALITGFLTPLFAFIAFLMALTFQFASGALFKYTILTSGYALPVLGSTLALTIGGARLPWSISGARPARAAKGPRHTSAAGARPSRPR